MAKSIARKTRRRLARLARIAPDLEGLPACRPHLAVVADPAAGVWGVRGLCGAVFGRFAELEVDVRCKECLRIIATGRAMVAALPSGGGV